MFVFTGKVSWQRNCPPAETKYGVQIVLLVFTPFMLAKSAGPSIGYCCELVISSIRMVLCVMALVPSITALQVSCVTMLQLDGLIE